VVQQLMDVEKNIAVFQVAIQRAQQFYSPSFPAVLVGDAAVTPHPEQGSGYTTGFRGFQELKTLFEALKGTAKRKETIWAFQNFNARYELHASRKAITGTVAILQNTRRMLETLASDLPEMAQSITDHRIGEALRRRLTRDAMTARGLAADVGDQEKLARDFCMFLGPDDGQDPPAFAWDNTAGRLWQSIALTWDDITKLTEDHNLLDDRLKDLKKTFKLS
jgi:hypothetical protein